jgi:hypothetical protein
MNTAKEHSVDKDLGFVRQAAVKDDEAPESSEDPLKDEGSYEDSWYQVLKAKASETDEA